MRPAVSLTSTLPRSSLSSRFWIEQSLVRKKGAISVVYPLSRVRMKTNARSLLSYPSNGSSIPYSTNSIGGITNYVGLITDFFGA
jgi:hypothetical protein